MNIVFAGTPPFTLPCLKALHLSEHHISAIYTQPDRPAGRGRKLQQSAVKTWAEPLNIPIHQPQNFKTNDAIDTLAKLKPDLMVVIAYGLILPQAILDIPRFGCINVHASLLPKWRGASPIQHAILHGDNESGVTIMQMDAGMDTGAIYTQATCPIHSHDTSQQLHDRIAELAAQPLLTTIEAIAAQSAHPEQQNNSLATYAPKISKQDAAINWSKSALEIDRKIRAFTPWPICFTHVGDQAMRVFKSEVINQTTHKPPGTIIALDKCGMLVATGHGCLLIDSIQFPGGKPLSIADWLNANRPQLHLNLVLK